MASKHQQHLDDIYDREHQKSPKQKSVRRHSDKIKKMVGKTRPWGRS